MMKMLLVSVLLSWVVLCAELVLQSNQAWPLQVPHGAVVIPWACAVMFWFRTASGIGVGGLVLLLNWIARPVGWPIISVAMPVVAAIVFTRTQSTGRFTQTQSAGIRRWSSRFAPIHHAPGIPGALQLPVLTMALVAFDRSILCYLELHTVGGVDLVVWSQAVARQIVSTGMIAVPFTAAASLLIVAADELGLRPAASRDALYQH